MNRRRRLLAGIAVVTVGMTAAACGSDDEGAATTVASTAPSSTSVAGPDASTDPTDATDPTGSAASSPPSSTAATTVAVGSPAAPSTASPTAPPGGVPSVELTELAEVDSPVGIAVRPGDDRLFAVSRAGTVVPVATDGTVGEQVLDIADLVTAGGEQGLLGLAFHPTEPLAYVNYTGNDGGATHIDEFRVEADGTFDADSRREVLTIEQPYANHNGGQVAFGPDGYLYIGMGDGGAGGDPERRGLDLGELLGKMLRIDPREDGGDPYSVPADNPYVGQSGAEPEIFSIGLRNPWRFSFDPSTGDLWIADVGQGEWEEIDVAWADEGGGNGANYGWSAFEGNRRFNADQPTAGAIPPIFEYSHGDGGCSVSGGALYRGAGVPSLDGWYVYGDYCAGEIRALEVIDRAVTREVTLGEVPSVSSVVAGPDGELYATSVDDDRIYAFK